MTLSPKASAYAAVTVASVIWGVSFVATKVALETIPPFTVLVLRFALASPFLWVLWRAGGGTARFSRRDILQLCALGLLEPGLYHICETLGLLQTSASVASLIIASMPVFTALLAAVLLREALSVPIVFGIALTVLGVAGLVWSGEAALAGASLAGNLFILGAAILAAIWTIVSRSLRRRHSAMTLTLAQSLFASIFFLPFAVREWSAGALPGITVEGAAAIFFLIFFATIAAYGLYNYGLGGLPAAHASVFINVIPLVTVVAAWGLLGERLSGVQAAGGGLILLGVTVTTGGRAAVSALSAACSRLFGRRDDADLPLVSPEQHVEGAVAAIAGPGGREGEHQALERRPGQP